MTENNMTPKEKAKELVEKYQYYVHGYIGSSMLTNTEYPEQILKQAKQCALIAVDEIIKSNPTYEHSNLFYGIKHYDNIRYWIEVKQEINKL